MGEELQQQQQLLGHLCHLPHPGLILQPLPPLHSLYCPEVYGKVIEVVAEMVVPYWTAWASPGPYSHQLMSEAGSEEHRARKTLQVILLSLAPPPACYSMPGESLGYNLCNARKEYLLSLQCSLFTHLINTPSPRQGFFLLLT